MLTPRSRRTALHVLFFASGGLGLVYEVLWMRRFTALFGGTALAGAVTLAAFFLGLAGGSAVFGARSRSWSRPLRAFGLLEIGVGLGALATLAILELHRLVYPTVLAALGGSAPLVLAAKLVLAFVAIGLPAFCMGGTLPALAETLAPSRGGLGQPVGGLYAANLAGAVAGTLSVPFVLLPQLGANGASVAAVLGSLLVGGAAAALGRRVGTRAGDGSGRHRGPPIDARSLRLLGRVHAGPAGALDARVRARARELDAGVRGDRGRLPGADGEAQVLDLLRTLPAELREALGVDP